MKVFCKHCNKNHYKPQGKENEIMYWESQVRGGRYRCREQVRHYNKEYRRTKRGWATTQRNTQSRSSKVRGHVQPNYNYEELLEWADKQQGFNELFKQWEYSDYERDLRPSCDRLDDDKPYTFDNLQIITQKENVLKGARSQKAKDNMTRAVQDKLGISVSKYGKDGVFIESYVSIGEAGRQNEIDQSNITKCCKGKSKTSGGYIWRYSEEGI